MEFDVKELDMFDKRMLRLIRETMPKECKKFMRHEGTVLARNTRNDAKKRLHKKTGNYFDSLRRSKAWENRQGGFGVKAYAKAPIGNHSHLLEYGHWLWFFGVFTGRKTTAFHIQENALNEYASTYYSDVKKFIHATLEKGIEGDV